MSADEQFSVNLPVALLPGETADDEVEDGIALCLSGGGYRAMLFHLGALWRLYELNLIQSLQRISSVSGGSITSALLGLRWGELSFEPDNIRDDFIPLVVDPVRRLAGKTIDANSVIFGALLPGSIADRVADAYAEHLYGDATLQDLPDDSNVRFIINATNMQSGCLWRFSKPYIRDWRVGEIRNPEIPLAVAVAASSAFPPVLSPLELEVDPDAFTPDTGADLQREPFTSNVVLSDGGVYDNLGLETCFKRYKTILVSDGGGKLGPEEEPKTDWARHSYRVLNVIDNQVRSLRKRQLIAAYKENVRYGTYWGIRSNIEHYFAPDKLSSPFDWSLSLAQTPTRLKRMPQALQEDLINWGYAVCDAAIRSFVLNDAAAPAHMPYE
ncbi:MAG: patatin [marine bacterium B5-7]|nr:MAG: patatin [marine bacterium B5-7]